MTVVKDNFTRANSGSLGANWTANSGATTTGAMGITSNAAKVQSSNQNAASFWNANSFSAKQYSEVILSGSKRGSSRWRWRSKVEVNNDGCPRQL